MDETNRIIFLTINLIGAILGAYNIAGYLDLGHQLQYGAFMANFLCFFSFLSRSGQDAKKN